MKKTDNLTKTIFLHKLEILCSVGVYEHEHINPQRIFVDAEVKLLIDHPPRKDKIEETLNYDLIYSGVKKIVQSRHFNLVETLTHLIFEYLSNLKGVGGVRVSVSKPDIYKDCEEVGYKISDL